MHVCWSLRCYLLASLTPERGFRRSGEGGVQLVALDVQLFQEVLEVGVGSLVQDEDFHALVVQHAHLTLDHGCREGQQQEAGSAQPGLGFHNEEDETFSNDEIR